MKNFPHLPDSSMSSGLDSTYGIWLISSFLQTILYGCGLLQAWLYFHWYSKDHWGVKTMVVLLIFFETLQVTFFFISAYDNLITHFGDVPRLFLIKWMDSAQLIAGFISGLIVQLYFAYCIYRLAKKEIFVPILIILLALISFGAGLAQTARGIEIGSFVHLQSTEVSSIIQCAGTFACDVAITVSLLRALSQKKTGFKATNTMLDMLMINAINRGVLTAVCAALTMILFLAVPGTFWFFLGVEISSKLYMNSALATLNSRQHIMNKTYPSSNPNGSWRSIHLRNLSTVQSQTVELEGSAMEHGSQVKVHTETHTYVDETPKHTFIDGMI